MTNEEWLARDEAALAPTLSRVHDIVATGGQGPHIWDIDGNIYLDFTSGIGALSTGHCHPKVVTAIQHQASQLIHTSVVTHNVLNVELAEKIGELTPWFEEPQIFFCNSGAEAVDGSLKLARRVTGQSGVIAFQGGFHGRTVAATSLTTAKGKFRQGYSPFLPYVFHAPYGEHLEIVEEIMACGPPRFPYKVGAIIVEPVLGEGGYIVPPVEWLSGLRTLCDATGALLIFDEVQTGVYRTGYPFAAETFRVNPDAILFAKGIASGLPLGGIIAEHDTFRYWPEGSHGSTFGGNPVSCAAAIATLDVLGEAKQLENMRWNGEYMINRLKANLKPIPVSGVGMMVRIELSDAETAKKAQQEMRELGLLVLTCGPNDNIIRLIPPLTINSTDLIQGISIIEKVLEK